MKAQWCVVLLIGIPFALPLSGCGEEVKLQENQTIMPVDQAKEARKYFEKASGVFDNLSQSDKEAYNKLFDGDQERGKKIWDLMANPPGSGPTGAPR